MNLIILVNLTVPSVKYLYVVEELLEHCEPIKGGIMKINSIDNRKES